MKRYLISIVIVLVVLVTAWPVFAQAQAGERRTTRPPATGREGRGRVGALSPEEAARLRERWRDMSEEEREQFRARMRERFETGRQGMGRRGEMRAFEQQIAKLKAEHEESVGELKAILELAKKEKASETAKRLQKLISKHQKEFDDRLKALEERRQRFQQMLQERTERRPRTERKKAPEFTLTSFDGKTVKLSDYRGKIVVLEWFNFECPYSKYHYETKKTMVSLANKYKGKNVVWLVINSTSHTTPRANKEFTRKYKLPFPILDDRSGKVGRAYGAKTTPHMYVIDPRGNIVYEGAIDNSPSGKTPAGAKLINYVDKALAELTTGRAVSTSNTKPYGCTVKYPK